MTRGDDDLHCEDPARRRLLVDSDLNGIDYIEVPVDDQTRIRVYFVKDPIPPVDPADVTIEGGVRITSIDVEATVVRSPAVADPFLEVTVDQAGDFSRYVLRIDAPGVLDPAFDHRPFGFKTGCPNDFDCLDDEVCPAQELEEPLIDYLAKDYASFRHMLLDLIPSRIPEWIDRHEADLGITLVELLAYEGDHISYAQDAAAQEMHLETARRRESVHRHTRLIDYRMHHGLNAKAFVQLQVNSDGVIPGRSLLARAETLAGQSRCPERTVQFATRIGQPIDPASSRPPGTVIPNHRSERATDAADAVFEPVETTRVHPDLNEIRIHTWGDRQCCLPAGSTSVDLLGHVALTVGDLLLVEEVRGVSTGKAADADPEHRQVVRISQEPEHTSDPLLGVDVTRISWELEDALTFPLCVSAVDEAGEAMPEVAVARGNILLVDHGSTATERHDPDPNRNRYSDVGYRFRLAEGPLTFGFPRDFRLQGPVASILKLDPRGAEAHVAVVDGDGKGFAWLPEPDLLGADPFSRSFVAEPGNDGRAVLRFGDGDFGRRPSFPTDPSQAEEHRLLAIHRIGNGRTGNVGAETIVHVIEPETFPIEGWPEIETVRNPMPAWGGVDPEPVDLVKEIAPDAFRAETYRAVTEPDYASAGELLATVARAEATFRWTGSWHTVFETIDPLGTDELTDAHQAAIRTHLSRYRQAGYDLEIDPPKFVPLHIVLVVCAGVEHFRPDVRASVGQALGSGIGADGTRGLFHPDNFTFGQPLHLSELYAAVEAVPGVDSLEVAEFHRYGRPPAGELTAGRIEVERLEIIRLDNDLNFPEHGVLTIEMAGGK